MDIVVLRRLEDLILRDVPGFRVAFKDQSKLMRVLGFLSFPFNPKFLTSFTTTLGKTVYFPTREFYEGHVNHSVHTLAHEYVHLWDTKQNRWFGVSYAFPQVLAVLPLLAFLGLAWPHLWLLPLLILGITLSIWAAHASRAAFVAALVLTATVTFGLSIWLVGWGTLALVAALLCLAPWPSPWRARWELRGYTMSIAMVVWLGGVFTAEQRERYVQHFVGPGYFFMSWRRAIVEKKIDEALKQAENGQLQGLSPFSAIRDLLYQHSLLRR